MIGSAHTRSAQDPTRRDFLAPATFNRVVYTADQRLLCYPKGGNQQAQQALRQVQGRPHRAAQHMMILSKARVVFQPMARKAAVTVRLPGAKIVPISKSCAFCPGRHAIKTWRKWVQQAYDYGWQVGHVLSFARGSKQLSLPSPF